MSLEGHVRATDKPIPKVGFLPSEKDINLQYWQDNWDIHSRLSRLYKDCGGDEPFNTSPVRLDMEDVCLLEYDALSGNFSNKDEEVLDVLDFCKVARKFLNKGNRVYYFGEW